MEATARRKVPGGKLLSIRLEHDGRSITKAELSGDFFLHPEESIFWLEQALIGVPIMIDENELALSIDGNMQRLGMVAVGFAPQDLASLIKEALG